MTISLFSGMMSQSDQKKPWSIAGVGSEGCERDYLRNEFTRRLQEGPVKYKLQIQFYSPSDKEQKDLSVWNPQKVRFRLSKEIKVLNKPSCPVGKSLIGRFLTIQASF